MTTARRTIPWALALLVALPTPLVAAIPATAVWECRTAGNATNGGGFDPSVASAGSDYSVQDAAQVTYADLVIGATTTQLTSAATPFTSSHVGNTICITSGTGFTAGWYSVRSVASAVATMDRAVGTASSTGGAGKLGGALNHPATAGGPFVAGNTLWIRSGTYDCGTTANASGGRLNLSAAGSVNAPNRIYGYGTARGDSGTRPVLRASASSVTILTASGASTFVRGLEFQGNSQTTSKGPFLTGNGGLLADCRFTGLSASPAAEVWGAGSSIEDCGATGCSGSRTISGAQAAGIRIARCTVLSSTVSSGGAAFYIDNASGASVAECVAANNPGQVGFATASNSIGVEFDRCLSRNNGGGGFTPSNASALTLCRSEANTGYGYAGPATYAPSVRLDRCSAWSNSLGNLAGNETATGFVALTADPATNAAGLDFSPNATAGGGAALKAVARTLPGLAGTSYPDIGAYQSQSTTGGVPRIGSPNIRGR